MSSDHSPEVKNILDKVEKLLRLAAANPNEQEAASATAKAQDLLAAYNLDMAAVEENSGGGGKRAQEDLIGGRYEWQRDLWNAVASLNFCLYFNDYVWVDNEFSATTELRKRDGKWVKARGLWAYQHRLVGRLVNIAATKAMATYLEGVCDRVVKERVKNTNERANGRWANSFRDGLTNRVISKIYNRRQEVLSDEQRKRQAQMEAVARSHTAGVSNGTALTLASYADSEEDANFDFVYGEGSSAKWAARQAAQAAAEKAAEEEYTKWAAANPEKARKQEQEKREKEERAANRRNQAYFKNKNSGAWSAGYEAGANISLDQQTEHKKARGLLK